MPTISVFYGIYIRMYFNDHNPPHLHARYGNAKSIVRLSDGVTLKGELPPIATKMVRDWTLAHRAELEDNWQRIMNGNQPEKIAGPDGRE